MNKKILLSLCVSTVLILSSCGLSDTVPSEQDTSSTGTVSSEQDTSSTVPDLDFNQQEKKPDVSKPSSVAEYDAVVISIDESNIHEIGETIEYIDVSFSEFSIIDTDTLPETIEESSFKHYNIYVDENGALKEEYTYIFATYDVTNITDTKQEYNFRSSSFVVLNSNLEIIDSSVECSYISDAGEGREAYTRVMDAGETQTVTTGYIIKKELVDSDDLYFMPTLSMGDVTVSMGDTTLSMGDDSGDKVVKVS